MKLASIVEHKKNASVSHRLKRLDLQFILLLSHTFLAASKAFSSNK